jgi:hypothetical protein
LRTVGTPAELFRVLCPIFEWCFSTARYLGYLMQRQLVAKVHAPNFAHHFMLFALCSPAQN